MLKDHNLIVDTFAEVYQLLKPWQTHEFWDFANHEPIENSVYVVGRKQLVECRDKIRIMCNDPRYVMIFCNAAEGSTTLREQCSRVLQIEDLILSGRLFLISGGDLPDSYPYMTYDHFLCCILDYDINLEQMQRTSEIFEKKEKPFAFLFLNGRGRAHRRYLLERFRMLGLLERSLYTYLDGRSLNSKFFNIIQDSQDLAFKPIEIKTLPTQYEVVHYRHNKVTYPGKQYFAKNDIFNHEWGEIYLQAEPYVDTYFSVVTETVFEEPWSFRTEKIAKVLAQGHPWICAASRGWYRDLRRMGFKTFDHIIDESFDLIDDHQDRMERIVAVVNDLCRQDLGSFLAQCEDVCKYNQQHLIEFSQRHRLDFPNRFLEFIKQHG